VADERRAQPAQRPRCVGARADRRGERKQPQGGDAEAGAALQLAPPIAR
jgi:hypothetical protein